MYTTTTQINKSMQIINLNADRDLIGKGKERKCYVHPENPNKAIKISSGPVTKQTDRELKFYRSLSRRPKLSFKHIPCYYGEINTNLGPGQMFDLIRDYDGQVSRSLLWYLQQGYSLDFFKKDLTRLFEYLVANQLIFNHDMYSGNILFKKKSADKGRLVIIDGLGDTVYLNWLNAFPNHRKNKIKRRWGLFYDRLKDRAMRIQQGKPIDV